MPSAQRNLPPGGDWRWPPQTAPPSGPNFITAPMWNRYALQQGYTRDRSYMM
jgi:hypothetical protein